MEDVKEEQLEESSLVLYKFTNRVESEDLDMLLGSFYKGVQGNAVGIMEAYNLDTEEMDVILVGVTLDEDGKPDCYPLARALKTAEIHRYLSPNGLGGYYDAEDVVENAEVKERMKPYHESVIKADTQDSNAEALGMVFNG